MKVEDQALRKELVDYIVPTFPKLVFYLEKAGMVEELVFQAKQYADDVQGYVHYA